MDAGTIVDVNQSLVVVFDTEHYDFSLARLRLYAHARDDDGGWSSPEAAANTADVLGDAFFANGGSHNVMLYSPDFRVRAEFRVSDYTR
jgi:hypothetical protein